MGYPLRWEQLAAPQIEELPQVEAAEPQVQDPAKLRRYFRVVVAVTVAASSLLVLTVVGAFSLLLNGRQPSALRLEPASGVSISAPAPKLYRRLGYAIVSGSLVNRTARSLDNVEADVDLLDGEQHVIRSQSAMIDRGSIAPGQSANYTVEMADAPQAKSCRLHFKQLYGDDLN